MTVSKKISYYILYAISTTGSWLLVYFGAIKHVPWTWNLFTFLVWLSLVVMGLVILALESDPDKKLYNSIQSINEVSLGLRLVEGYLMSCFVAATGHWFYAALVFLGMIVTDLVLRPKEEEVKAL